MQKKKKYGHKGKNTKLDRQTQAELCFAALYEEFQRTGLSLIYILFISESQDSSAQFMTNLQKD